MRRSLRGLVWTLAVVGALLALLVLAVQVMTRTAFGMERARRYAAGWLEGQVTGEVSLGRITGDNLLGGVTVHTFVIRGADGRAFVDVDSLVARYDWSQLVRGRIVVDEVDVHGGVVRVEQMPGDSLWNYQRVFAGDDAAGGGSTRLVRLDDVRLFDTDVTVAMPDASGGQGRFVTERVDGGRLRLYRFSDVEGWFGPVLWQSPSEPGRTIRIRSLSGMAGILEDAVRIVNVEGMVTLRDSVTSLDLDRVELPSSRFNVAGTVIASAAGPRFDLRGDGHVELADVAWMVPGSPGGEADLDLRMETLDDGSLSLRSERIEYRTAGAEIDGSFGYVTGRAPALRGVDLRIGRAEVAWLDSVLPVALNLEGRLSGRLRADGPLSGFRTSGDVQLRRPDRSGAAQVSWSGTLAVQPGIAAHQLETELRDVDLDLLEMVRPGLGLAGTVDGRVGFEGSLADGMQVRGLLSHHEAAGTSLLDGVVTIAMADSGAVTNGRFTARPLRLEALNRVAPQLAWLRGAAEGAVAFDTRLDSVRVGADLRLGDGRAEFGVVLDLGPERPILDGSGSLTAFAPEEIGATAFAESVSGAFDFRIEASDLSQLSGSAHFELDSARVRGFPVERSAAWLRFRDGTAILDSAVARAPGLVGRAEGSLGLVADRAGELRAELSAESLNPLERVFLGSIEDPTQPRIGGSLSGMARVRGSIAAFDLDANLSLENLHWLDRSADRVEIGLLATGVGTDAPSWDVDVRGDTLVALGTEVDSLVVGVRFAEARAGFDGETWTGGVRTSRLAGAWLAGDSITSAAFDLDSLVFASGTGLWTLRQRTRIALDEGSALIDGLTLEADSGGAAHIRGRIAIADPASPGTRPLDFTFDLQDVAFSTLPHQVRPLGTVSGVANGQLRLAGTATEPIIDAGLEIANLSYQGETLERVSADLAYRDQRLDATISAAKDSGGVRAVLSGGGFAPLDLRLGRADQRVLDQPMDMSVRLDSFPAAFAFGLVPGFTNIGGTFEGRMQVNGSARNPRLVGTMALVGAAATWDATGVRYVEAEGTFLMQEDLRTRIDVTARTVDTRGRDPVGGRRGTARITGVVDLTRTSDPELDLALEAERMLATRRREAEIVMSGQATLTGRYRRPRVSGTLRVDGGNLYLDEIYRQYLIVGLQDPLFFDVVDTTLVSVRRVLPPTENPFLRNLLIEDTQITVASGTWLRSREMDVEVRGNVNVDFDRLAGDLRMQGTLIALRGTYRLEYPGFARIFEVREGEVDFPGTPGIDPSLNIQAAYRARTAGGEPLDIYAVVSGTLQAPRIRLRSDVEPPISESDLASYLFFGTPTSAFNLGGGTGESGVFGGLGSRAFAASGLGYFASGLQTLAQSFGLVDYVGLTAAETADPGGPDSGLGGLLATTRIELGRYLTPRLFVAYTQRLASGNRGAGVRLEWRLTPTYTLDVFAEDRFARAPSFSLSQLISARKEIGFFLFREWGY